MATKHPRLNVTLNPEIMGLLTMLARKEDKSLSAVAGKLLEEALEMHEDLYFTKLANERDTPDAVWISHEDVWK